MLCAEEQLTLAMPAIDAGLRLNGTSHAEGM